jgi:hypothetical protein
MTSGAGARLTLLQGDISAEIHRVERQRRKSKARALSLRMATVSASATATVLLGLKITGNTGAALTDLALVFSALATVAVAADAFCDPRNLWIMEVGHLSRVRSLDRRLAAGHHVAAGQGRTPRPFPRSKAGRPARPPASGLGGG